jgi:hypothetical protein
MGWCRSGLCHHRADEAGSHLRSSACSGARARNEGVTPSSGWRNAEWGRTFASQVECAGICAESFANGIIGALAPGLHDVSGLPSFAAARCFPRVRI